MDLNDRVMVITGASSGIGAATAELLREAGMRLVINGRRAQPLEELAERLGETVAIAGDVTDPALPQRLIDAAVERFGRCDAVFNNAGVLHVEPFDDVDIEKVCRMVRINVEAAFRMVYVALKHFKAQGYGELINTSSILGTKVRATAGWYGGTKWALEGLCEALRMEFAGTDIRISAIEPGLVVTGLHRDWGEPAAQRLNIKDPLTPRDIAGMVRYLLEQPKHVRIPRLMVLPGEQPL